MKVVELLKWLYMYSGKHSRVKTFAIWWKYDFHGENFRRLLTGVAAKKDAMPPNFTEKTFTNSYKTSKFCESFLPRKFPTIQYVLCDFN